MPSDAERHKVTRLSECDVERHMGAWPWRWVGEWPISYSTAAYGSMREQRGAAFSLATRHPVKPMGWAC